MSYREARLTGMRAAAEAHYELGIKQLLREGAQRVDVFKSIVDLDIAVVCKPLDGLLGLYLSEPMPGILVSSNLRSSVQRYTAAHELGHHWLRHSGSLDTQETIGLARGEVNFSDNTQMEVEADCFASEFLMPKQLIVNIARHQQWSKTDLANPENIYQMSLRAGVSYQATVVALSHNDILGRRQSDQLIARPPRQAKVSLLNGVDVEDYRSDVIHLRSLDSDGEITVTPGDILAVDLQEKSTSGYTWQLQCDNSKSIANVCEPFYEKSIEERPVEIGGEVLRRIFLSVLSPNLNNPSLSTGKLHLKHLRAWESEDSAVGEFVLSVNVCGRESGLPRVARSRI